MSEDHAPSDSLVQSLDVDERRRRGEELMKEGRYKESCVYLSSAAGACNVRAMVLFGVMLRHGLGVEKDQQRAVQLYRFAAEQGNDLGMYYYAVYLDEGLDIVEKDPLHARQLWRKAYDGLLKGADADQDKAAGYYEKAAAQGHFIAMHKYVCDYIHYLLINSLGWRAENHNDDLEQARHYYEQAALRGYPSSQTNLARIYEREGNLEKALYWFERAVAKGYARAQSDLGCLYYTGTGVPQNLTRAFELFEMSANQGYEQGLHNLACLYQNGDGTEVNYKRAFECFSAAAAKGNEGSRFNAGYLYLCGFGVEENREKAIMLFEESAQNGSASLKFKMGKMCRSGTLGKEYIKAADAWFRKAADAGSVRAQTMMALSYEEHAIAQSSSSLSQTLSARLSDSSYEYAEARVAIPDNISASEAFLLSFELYNTIKENPDCPEELKEDALRKIKEMFAGMVAPWDVSVHHLFPPEFHEKVETLLMLSLVQCGVPRFPQAHLWLLPLELLVMICEHAVLVVREDLAVSRHLTQSQEALLLTLSEDADVEAQPAEVNVNG